MLKFILRRLLISIPLLLGVALLSFLMIHLAPGDYFQTMRADPQISAETVQKFQEQYHLDKPFFTQFGYWLLNLFQGDLGYSFTRKAPVSSIIGVYAFNTFVLAFFSLILTWMIGVPLGILSAQKHNKRADKTISFLSLIGMSIPNFILTMLLLLGASQIGLPIGGMKSLNYDSLSFFGKMFDVLKHLLVPGLAITILSTASLIRITRANMLEVLKKPFLLTARSYGLDEKTVHKKAFRSAVNPLITLLGYEFSGLLSGAAIIEIITNWPGLGSVMLEAVMSQDLYLVMGGIMMGSVLLIIGNLIADILLSLVDPRINLE